MRSAGHLEELDVRVTVPALPRRVAVLVVCLTLLGCIPGMEPERASFVVFNQTEDSLFLTSGSEELGSDKAGQDPVEEAEVLPKTLAGTFPYVSSDWGSTSAGECLVETIIARDAAGNEVARLWAGTCWNRSFRWAIGEPPVEDVPRQGQ